MPGSATLRPISQRIATTNRKKKNRCCPRDAPRPLFLAPNGGCAIPLLLPDHPLSFSSSLLRPIITSPQRDCSPGNGACRVPWAPPSFPDVDPAPHDSYERLVRFRSLPFTCTPASTFLPGVRMYVHGAKKGLNNACRRRRRRRRRRRPGFFGSCSNLFRHLPHFPLAVSFPPFSLFSPLHTPPSFSLPFP